MDIKRNEIIKTLLLLAASGAFVGLAVLAPNAVGPLVKEFQKLKRSNAKKLKKSFYYLKQRGLVTIGEEGDETIVTLTEKGQKRVLKYKLEEMKIQKPKKWDKKWRVVIFDIPKDKKQAREILRSKLKELGFYGLQKSVFVYPYPCYNELDFLVEIYEIRPFVKLILAESLDDTERLLDFFDL